MLAEAQRRLAENRSGADTSVAAPPEVRRPVAATPPELPVAAGIAYRPVAVAGPARTTTP
jgi:hypothetical protein